MHKRSDIPPTPFSELFASGRIIHSGKLQTIVDPYDEPRGVYLLLQGYMRVYDIDKDGNNQLLALLGPGQLFPLYWALGEEAPTIYFETVTACDFAFLPREMFLQQVLDSKQLLRQTLKHVLDANRASELRIQNLEIKDAEERIAFRLLYLIRYFGRSTANETGVDIAIPVFYQDIADAVNLTRETVNRVMRGFAHESCLRLKGQRLIVDNPIALQQKVHVDFPLNL